jgi:hypothetical protein
VHVLRRELIFVYDIIGDLHGHADELRELLETLGFKERRGFYSHPERKAVFVGDFIDRGPKIRDTLGIVRSMIDNDAAVAVMGNHEFNAIAYHTSKPGSSGEYFREHSDKNKRQHEQTLKQLSATELSDAIEWFKTLPVCLELDGIRVVHACWYDHAITTIERSLRALGRYAPEFLAQATVQNPPSELLRAIDNILKGPEVQLPDGMSFPDKDGNERSCMRVKWFESPDRKSYRDYEMPVRGRAPNIPITAGRIEVSPYAATDLPLFFGHYWLTDNPPSILAPNIACVDYSIAAHGMLCAYRWNASERVLQDDCFITVRSFGSSP